jgi:hypothetical protein
MGLSESQDRDPAEVLESAIDEEQDFVRYGLHAVNPSGVTRRAGRSALPDC